VTKHLINLMPYRRWLPALVVYWDDTGVTSDFEKNDCPGLSISFSWFRFQLDMQIGWMRGTYAVEPCGEAGCTVCGSAS
jgi:hypothetical protein